VLAGTIPLITLTGDTSNVTPLQTTVDIAVTAGVGFTNTVTVNVVPMEQLVVFGVTVYTAVLTVLVALKSVPKILVWSTVADCPPVSEPVLTAGVVHVYFVPIGTIPLITSVGVTWN
jgi:hypothetical protein